MSHCAKASPGPLTALVLTLLLAGLSGPAFASDNPDAITWDRYCFTINGQDLAVYSGSIHYFRTAPGEWRDRLIKARAAGFNAIATYIPWNWHEPVQGQLDLTELEDFIDMCDELGLFFIARPGPYICSEWDNAAYPDWLPANGISNAALRNHDNPRYVELVRKWYNDVAEVLRPRLITNGGNVIAVQIENEYHFGSHHKVHVIRNLYRFVREAGLDVPVITCYTPFAWDNDDPIMADIINGNNSGQARWNNVEHIEQAAAESHREENNAPTICLENPMGQGNYTNFTGRENAPLTGNDFSVVNKTIWGEGGGLTNYYMLYGGTNFEYWGSDYQSTTYASRQPVSCPINEPGGLLESYYEVKLIGHWLESFGPTLVRANPETGARIVDCRAQKQPRLVYRRNGESGFFFIREAQDQPQQLRLAYTDPATGREITIPSVRHIELPARRMIILTTNFPLQNALLRYATSELLSAKTYQGHDVVVLYGPTNAPGQLALKFDSQPDVQGSSNHNWNADDKTLTLDYSHTPEPQFVRIGNVVAIILDRDRAHTTWYTPTENGDTITWITNAYLIDRGQPAVDDLTFPIQARPGSTDLAAFFPNRPEITLDGRVLRCRYDRATGRLDAAFHVEPKPFPEITIKNARFQVEDFTAGDDWQPIDLYEGLEEQNIVGKGYVRYTATFDADDADSMILRYFLGSANDGPSLGDAALAYINGRLVTEISGNWVPRRTTFDVKKYVQPGQNRMDVVIERRPRPRGGAGMCQPKGLAAASLVGPGFAPWQKEVTDWKLSLGLHGQQLGWFQPDFDDSNWKAVPLGDWKSHVPKDFVGIGWYRFDFDLDESADFHRPLQLSLDLDKNALIYLNGRLVGRYHESDWQRDFYLPQDWLDLNGNNTIAIAVRNDPTRPGDKLPTNPGLRKATIRDYQPWTVKNATITVNF